MPMPIFALASNGFLRRDGKDFFQLALHRRNVSVRQIDFVDDRNNRQPLFVSEMNVRHGLRFDALRRIHHQQRALACGEAARNFISEIDMARACRAGSAHSVWPDLLV